MTYDLNYTPPINFYVLKVFVSSTIIFFFCKIHLTFERAVKASKDGRNGKYVRLLMRNQILNIFVDQESVIKMWFSAWFIHFSSLEILSRAV